MAEKKWSNQQVAIFQNFSSGNGNLVVDADAGTGKTTTIINALSHIVGSPKVLMCAFNKRIAEELSQRIEKINVSASVEAKTLHSLGFAFVRYSWKGVRVDGKRGNRLAQKACGRGATDNIINAVAKLSSLAKGCAHEGGYEDLENLAYDKDIFGPEIEKDGYTLEDLIVFTQEAMNLALEKDGTIDFDDMIFVPVRNNWVRAWYNVVIVDECQDMNAAQIEMALRACKKGGRIIVVGDEKQAIYGFRGADSRSLTRLKEELNAETLGLNTTYRCPKKVVERVKHLAPNYVAHENNPEGIVDSCKVSELTKIAVPGNAIISRKNAPLMGLCLSFLKNGIRAYIEGKDFGKQLCNLVNKIAGKRNSIPEFLEKLSKWEEKQIARLRKANGPNEEARVEQICDTAECLRVLATDLASISELKARIETLFEDTGDRRRDSVILSSIHKSKGLEFPRVFGLEYTLGNQQGESLRAQEERNLEYVMVTRAMEHYTSVGEG